MFRTFITVTILAAVALASRRRQRKVVPFTTEQIRDMRDEKVVSNFKTYCDDASGMNIAGKDASAAFSDAQVMWMRSKLQELARPGMPKKQSVLKRLIAGGAQKSAFAK